MKNNLVRKLLIVTLAMNALPLLAQEATAAGPEGKHIGLPIDWSSRHVVHSVAIDQDFEKAAGHEPRLLFNYFQRKHALEATQAGRLRGAQVRKSSVQRDWNLTLGSGTVAPNMAPAKFGYSITAAPDCTNDFAVYGLNVAGVSTGSGTAQPNLVGVNNLYAGSLGTGVAIATAAEVGTTVTITTSAAHGLVTGDSVTISGVSQAGYTGTFVVTVTGALTFTYTDATTGLLAGVGGTSTKSGLCGLAPSVKFAYNISTAGEAIVTSPVISLDGTKVAFIESKLSSAAITGTIEAGTTVTITAPAHGFAVGDTVIITGVTAAGYNGTNTILTVPTANTFTYTSLQGSLAASSGGTANVAKGGAIFSILTIGTTGNNGSFTSPLYTVSPPAGGTPANNASILSTTYTTAGNTRSSPYVDFANDIAYFGDDAGVLYRSSCVFGCLAPPTVTALNSTIGAATKFASPVVDSYNGQLFAGGSDGKLYSIVNPQTCSGLCTPTSVTVGSNTAFGGVVDAPIIDSGFHTVITTTGDNAGTAVEAVQYNYSLATLGTTVTAGTAKYPLVNGALNDEYYNNTIGSPTVTGAGYFCGPTGGSGQADLYTVQFTSGTNTITATGASEVGTTVTLTTTAAHGLTTAANAGQQIKVAGVGVAGYNGTWTILTAAGTTITYTAATSGMAASGNGTVTKPLTASNPPVLSTNTATPIAGPNKATCSTFLTMTAGGTERLFFSQPNVPKNTCTGSGALTTEGCVLTYTINTSTGVATLGPTLSVLSGSSGSIIDNSSSAGQASSLYFANQALVGDAAATHCTYTAGATPAYCAIKVTQSTLQ